MSDQPQPDKGCKSCAERRARSRARYRALREAAAAERKPLPKGWTASMIPSQRRASG